MNIKKISEKKFTKSIDIVLLNFCVLKRLGCGKVDTFQHRLKNQKVHYFAQLFRVSFFYPYNLYLRGPYSPGLANDLYLIKKNKIEATKEEFIPEELEDKFKKLKKFIKDKNLRDLELLSTLHWLSVVVKMSKKEAEKKLIELKNATQEEIKKSFNFLKIYGEQNKKNFIAR